MSEEASLVEALVLAPGDEALLGVFLDWLEDRGVDGGLVELEVSQRFRESRSFVFVYGVAQVTVATRRVITARWRTLPQPDFLPAPALAPEELQTAASGAQPVNSWAGVKGLALRAMLPEPGESPRQPSFSRSSFRVRGRDVSLVGPVAVSREGPRAAFTAALESVVAVSEILRPPPAPAPTPALFVPEVLSDDEEEERRPRRPRKRRRGRLLDEE